MSGNYLFAGFEALEQKTGSSPTVRKGSFQEHLTLYFEVVEARSDLMQDKEPFKKIKALPPEKIAEVVDFVDVLAHRSDRFFLEAAMKISEPAFAAVWDNPDDAEYDKL